MSLNSTPLANRIHIGIFGRRNAGKSSLINALTGQSLAIVSDVAGTTTDPVSKAMELLPLGPVVITDTAGIDDVGELGQKRVEKSLSTLSRTDIAVFVIPAGEEISDDDAKLLFRIAQMNIPLIKVRTKCDITNSFDSADGYVCVSSATGQGIDELKKALTLAVPDEKQSFLVSDLLDMGDIILLVIPIDESAPKGRLILPQQQVIRDALDCGAVPICTKPETLTETLSKLSVKPKLIVTDSQVFGQVAKLVPEDIPLTSFSILMARFKGILDLAYNAVMSIEKLENGDKVLISEGCTHHRQCGDIGSVKIPALIRKHTGKNVDFEVCSGNDFPECLDGYALVVHCGGCTLTEQVMQRRLLECKEKQVPITNYGMAIAYMNGILSRSMEIFIESKRDLKQ